MSSNAKLLEKNIKELENKMQINSLKDFLIEKYNKEGLSTGDISYLIYNNRTKDSLILKYMIYFGIKRRTSSESKRLAQIHQIEKQLNISSFKEFLIQQYWENQLGLSQIAEIVYSNKKNEPSILRWMKYFNIERRNRSESVKLQYKGEKGDIRRKKCSNIAKKFLNSKEARSKLINIMQTKEYKYKQKVSKLGEKNGMYGVLGEKHPAWNPNKTRLQRQKDRKIPENREFIKKCLERDKYTCTVCGCKSKKFNVHHLNSYNWYTNGRFDTSNGVTLCEKCHKKFHHIYGYGNNTKKQFEVFKLKYIK